MAATLSRGTESYGWRIERRGRVATSILVAGIESQVCTGLQSEADASLIAAAPLMLVALKDLVAYERCNYGNITCVFCRAVVVIAAAEGR